MRNKRILLCPLVMAAFTASFAQPVAPSFAQRFNIGTGSQEFRKMQIDVNGNVYVGGSTNGGGTNVLLCKYSNTGTLLWQKSIDHGGNTDTFADITLDWQSNPYICWTTKPSGGTSDMAVSKYLSDGTFQWTKVKAGVLPTADDLAADVVVDNAGSVFAIGSRFGIDTAYDMWVVKYDALGTELWEKSYDRFLDNDMGLSGGLDSAGNVYVGGTSRDGNQDIQVVKWDSNGTFLWEKHFDGAGAGDDNFGDMEVAPDGTCYIGGRADNGALFLPAILKYTAAGGVVFESTITLPKDAKIVDIAVQSGVNNIFATGDMDAGSNNIAFLALKVSAAGTYQWHKTSGPEPDSSDHGRSVTVDADGNSYFSGTTIAPVGGDDVTAIKYNPAGVSLWSILHNGPGNNNDAGLSIGLDPHGNVMIAGYTLVNFTNVRDGLLLKYYQAPVAVADTYTALQNTTLNVGAPGVIGNDKFKQGAKAVLVGSSTGAITLNANGSFTYTPMPGIAGTDSFSYRLERGTQQSNVVNVTINVKHALQAITLASPSVQSGSSTSGTVVMTGFATGGGSNVALTDNSSAITVPASVNVPAGNDEATFNITTTPVNSNATRQISGTFDGVTKTASLTLLAGASLANLSLNPSTVKGGQATAGTVTLSAAAGAGGLVVTLSDNSGSVSTPPNVTVSSGATSAGFTVNTSPVAATATRQVSATYNGVTKTANITLTP